MRVLLVSDAYPPVFGGYTSGPAARAAAPLWGARNPLPRPGSAACRRSRLIVGSGLPDAQYCLTSTGPLLIRCGIPPRPSRTPIRSAPPAPERDFAPDVIHTYRSLTYSRAQKAPTRVGRARIRESLSRPYARPTRPGRGTRCGGPAWGKCLECAGTFYGRQRERRPSSACWGSGGGSVTEPMPSIASVASASRPCEAICWTTRQYPPRSFRTSERTTTIYRIPRYSRSSPRSPSSCSSALSAASRATRCSLSVQATTGSTAAGDGGRPQRRTAPGVPCWRRATDRRPSQHLMAIWDRALFGVCPSIVSEASGTRFTRG